MSGRLNIPFHIPTIPFQKSMYTLFLFSLLGFSSCDQGSHKITTITADCIMIPGYSCDAQKENTLRMINELKKTREPFIMLSQKDFPVVHGQTYTDCNFSHIGTDENGYGFLVIDVLPFDIRRGEKNALASVTVQYSYVSGDQKKTNPLIDNPQKNMTDVERELHRNYGDEVYILSKQLLFDFPSYKDGGLERCSRIHEGKVYTDEGLSTEGFTESGDGVFVTGKKDEGWRMTVTIVRVKKTGK